MKPTIEVTPVGRNGTPTEIELTLRLFSGDEEKWASERFLVECTGPSGVELSLIQGQLPFAALAQGLVIERHFKTSKRPIVISAASLQNAFMVALTPASVRYQAFFISAALAGLARFAIKRDENKLFLGVYYGSRTSVRWRRYVKSEMNSLTKSLIKLRELHKHQPLHG